ncbi:hypothetical protein JCM5296_006899 [Sporobolomyces johnsonii]
MPALYPLSSSIIVAASASSPPSGAAQPYLQLHLSCGHQARISAHTPFRFHPVSLPTSTAACLEPYLPIPHPALPLILTPPRPGTDYVRQVSTLNDPSVALNLVGPPYPLLAGDGLGESERSRRRRSGSPNDRMGSRSRVCEWIGEIAVQRWQFREVDDLEERETLVSENEAKEAGDETIVWSFGYYLHPSYHAQSIASSALHAVLNSYLVPFLGARHIRATAFADNLASLRVQEKQGLKKLGVFRHDISESRGGGTTEEVVMEWKA